MSTKRNVKFILGYALGGVLFLVLVPWGLVALSRAVDPLIGISLIPNDTVRIALALILVVIGLGFGIWTNVLLNTLGEGGPFYVAKLDVSPKTQHLVTRGPYRYSRNPMLFGTLFMFCGVGVYLDSLAVLAVAVLFIVFMLTLIVPMEERRLRAEFGAEYEDYCRRVSRFIPWFPRRTEGADGREAPKQ